MYLVGEVGKVASGSGAGLTGLLVRAESGSESQAWHRNLQPFPSCPPLPLAQEKKAPWFAEVSEFCLWLLAVTGAF